MGHSVVVVDDENAILRILEEVLVAEGYEPLTFLDARKAFEYALHNKPDLVITDLLMPGMSGQELVHLLKEHVDKALPIAVMSASANMSAVARLPVQAFLSKPFDIDELLTMVSELLGEPRVFSGAHIPIIRSQNS